MLLPELKKVAAGLGIKGASTMRKADLIAAISGNQSSGHPATPQKSAGAASVAPTTEPPTRTRSRRQRSADSGQRAAEQAPQAELTGGTEHPAIARSERSEHSVVERVDRPVAEPTRDETEQSLEDSVGARLAALGQDPKVRERLRERETTRGSASD